MVALDLDNNRVYFGKNGTWFSSGNPATNTNPAFNIASGTYSIGIQDYHASGYPITYVANFGQRAFAYTPPAGFKSLNTKNMNEQSAFVTGPDLVWIKRRDSAGGSSIHDTVRGITRHLTSNSLDAEYNEITGGGITSVSSNGFTLGIQNVGPGDTNAVGGSYVAWCWNAGSRTVGNESGSISSTVRANPATGFSIVSYVGNNTAGATVGHGLGTAPSMIIVRNRLASDEWWHVYHRSLGATRALFLNNTNVAGTNAAWWNNTEPNSSVFTLGTTSGAVNGNGASLIAYCWAEIPGYSKFGSYTGNGSSNGPFIYTGFKPKFVMLKASGDTGSWNIVDGTRNPSNVVNARLFPNSSIAENTATVVDFLSNGFKIRSSDSDFNYTVTNIYMAFAETPFNYSNAR
jgi:hypothetical protein